MILDVGSSGLWVLVRPALVAKPSLSRQGQERARPVLVLNIDTGKVVEHEVAPIRGVEVMFRKSTKRQTFEDFCSDVAFTAT